MLDIIQLDEKFDDCVLELIADNQLSSLTIAYNNFTPNTVLKKQLNALQKALEKNTSIKRITIYLIAEDSIELRHLIYKQKLHVFQELLSSISRKSILFLEIDCLNSDYLFADFKSSQEFTDFLFTHLPQSLRSLTIKNCSFSNLKYLANLLNSKHLSSLCLNNTGITDNALSFLIPACKKNNNLLMLDLSKNSLTKSGLQFLEAGFKNHPNILSINLTENNITPEEIKSSSLQLICAENLQKQIAENSTIPQDLSTNQIPPKFAAVKERWKVFLPRNAQLQHFWEKQNNQYDWAQLCSATVELAVAEIRAGNLHQLDALFYFLMNKRLLIALILNQEDHGKLFCETLTTLPPAIKLAQVTYKSIELGIFRTKFRFTHIRSDIGPYLDAKQFEQAEEMVKQLTEKEQEFHKVFCGEAAINTAGKELGFGAICDRLDIEEKHLLKLIVIYGNIQHTKTSEPIPLTATLCYRDKQNIGHLYLFHKAPFSFDFLGMGQSWYEELIKKETKFDSKDFTSNLGFMEFYLSHAMLTERGCAAILKILRQIPPGLQNTFIPPSDTINSDILAMLTPKSDDFIKVFLQKPVSLAAIDFPGFAPSQYIGLNSKPFQLTLELIHRKVLSYNQVMAMHPLHFYLLETKLLPSLIIFQQFPEITINFFVNLISHLSFNQFKGPANYLQEKEHNILAKEAALHAAADAFNVQICHEIIKIVDKHFKNELVGYLEKAGEVYKKQGQVSQFFASFSKERVFIAELVWLLKQDLQQPEHLATLCDKVSAGVASHYSVKLIAILEKYDFIFSNFLKPNLSSLVTTKPYSNAL